MDTRPKFWPTLAYVCRRWRQIVFRSPKGLDLRLYCERGRPVSRSLDFWSAVPIVVRYGGSPSVPSDDPLSPEDEDDIVVALKQSGRVHSINLTITSSLLPKFLTIEEPFTELEELVLLSRNNVQLTIPGTFRWGPRLHRLHSTRISFPALPQLLSSSKDLVDLQLHEIPSIGYVSPKAFANALSGMTRLQSISLHFLSPTSRPSHVSVQSPGVRVVLPALTRLKFRGASEYLNDFVTRIDTARLKDIEVTFFNQLIFDISQLVRFIDRIEVQKLHREAVIRSSGGAVSLAFAQPGNYARFTLQISCEHLDWQSSSMAQICGQFSTSGFLFGGVTDLLINTTQPSSGQGNADSEHWPELIHSFSSIEKFSLQAGGLMTNILRALQAAVWESDPLPALKFLCIAGVTSCDLLAAIRSIVTPLQASGRLVQVTHTNTGSRGTKTLTIKEEHEGGCKFCGSSECPDAAKTIWKRRQRQRQRQGVQNDDISNPFSPSYPPFSLPPLSPPSPPSSPFLSSTQFPYSTPFPRRSPSPPSPVSPVLAPSEER